MERDDATEQGRSESLHLSAPDHDVCVLTSTSDYIQIRTPVYVTHSAGRYAAKRFRKAQCPIIERLTNSMMMNGRNNGKKLMAVRIVSHAFEIVRLHDGVLVLRN